MLAISRFDHQLHLDRKQYGLPTGFVGQSCAVTQLGLIAYSFREPVSYIPTRSMYVMSGIPLEAGRGTPAWPG